MNSLLAGEEWVHMISRHWRGLAKSRHADEYLEHLRTETLPQLTKIPGFVNASILRRRVQQGDEFLVVTTWESNAAIQRFSGGDTERAVVPEKVRAMMIEYDRRVRHYEVVA
jgi:heme-degrading monooxygenase HmoA